MKDITKIITACLTDALGVPKLHYNQIRYCCPKCDAGKKYNLEICCNSNDEFYLRYHCWSCHMKGFITNLLRTYSKSDIWRNDTRFKEETGKYHKKIEKDLKYPQNTIPFYLNKEVLNYFQQERKLNIDFFKKRKVQYVFSEREPLYNNIIFPFYEDDILVGYTTQNLTTKKYKNHGKLNYIPYKEFIDEEYPITLLEGIYDNAVIPNSIPTLGTKINSEILLYCKDKNIILGLDKTISSLHKSRIIADLKKYSPRTLYALEYDTKDANEDWINNREELITNYNFIVKTILENE